MAIDASMCLYQFLIAVRAEGSQLVGSDGETTRSVGARTVSISAGEETGSITSLKTETSKNRLLLHITRNGITSS